MNCTTILLISTISATNPFFFLSFECNSIRLGGPSHGIVTKACTQNSAGGGALWSKVQSQNTKWILLNFKNSILTFLSHNVNSGKISSQKFKSQHTKSIGGLLESP